MPEESGSSQKNVVAHYSRYSEKDRFQEPLARLEYLRSCEILGRHLPPEGLILDIGGGPGHYARWLLERGYSVWLLDPVPLHIRQAGQLFDTLQAGSRARAIQGTATSLPFDDQSADAALLMGPLYHLSNLSDRLQALSECMRVLKPGAPLFAAAISRFASLIDGLDREFLWDPVFEKIVRQDLETGRHQNPTGNLDYFTDGHFHRPLDLAQEIQQAGFTEVRVLAVEGPLWADPNLSRNLQHATRSELLLELARQVEQESSLTGASPHLMAVAKKPLQAG